MDLKNALNPYGIRLSNTGTGGLTIVGQDDGTNTISAQGASSGLSISSAGTAGTTINAVGPLTLETSTDTLILGATTGGIIATCEGSMEYTSNNNFISFDAGPASYISLTAGTNVNLTAETGNVQINTTSGNVNVSANNALNLSSITSNINLNTQTLVNHNLQVSQNSYAQPMASQFQLGYTGTATGSVIMTATLAQRATFTISQKGVWLIVLGYQWTGGASNTITLKQAVISTTSGGATPAAPGLRYYEAIDAPVTAVLQQQGTIMGVFTATASTALFLNALATVNTLALPTLAWSISWTRIG
jgi:hypothetical protein